MVSVIPILLKKKIGRAIRTDCYRFQAVERLNQKISFDSAKSKKSSVMVVMVVQDEVLMTRR